MDLIAAVRVSLTARHTLRFERVRSLHGVMDRRTIRPKEVKEDGALAPGGCAVDDPIHIVGHAASFFRRKPQFEIKQMLASAGAWAYHSGLLTAVQYQVYDRPFGTDRTSRARKSSLRGCRSSAYEAAAGREGEPCDRRPSCKISLLPYVLRTSSSLLPPVPRVQLSISRDRRRLRLRRRSSPPSRAFAHIRF